MALVRSPLSISPLFLMALALGVTPAFAHTDDSQTLGMFYDERDLAVVTRTVRPASQSAEEVTVITAEEIRMRNVHTLADLIATIPGVSAHSTFIWDLDLSGEVYTAGHRRLVLFLSLHNLFDGSQYPAVVFTNPGRWVEGGVRAVF